MNKETLRPIARDLANQYAKNEIDQGYKPAGLHPYYDEVGNLIYIKIRLKHSNGKKWIRPFYLEPGRENWIIGEPSFCNGKPLYYLNDIHQHANETVYVVEGENCVEVLNKFNLVATTSGSSTSVENANWEPLRGRKVCLWPDNDESGQVWLETLVPILVRLNCSIRVVDVEQLNLNEGDDCINWFAKKQENQSSITQEDITSLPLQIFPIDAHKPDANGSTLIEDRITRLAELSPLEYDRIRKKEAKDKGLRVSSLDKLVKTKQNQHSVSSSQIIFSEIELLPEVIDGEQLLFTIFNLIKKITVLGDHEANAIALWIVFTYCIDAFFTAPILHISSPEKRCGKSTLVSLLNMLVKNSLPASNITPAAIFRTIETCKPTLLLDEVDTFINNEKSELRGIINSGHTTHSAFVIRTVGDQHEPKHFSTWSAKCLAGIGQLPDTIQDRSITIQLRRKLPAEQTEKLRNVPQSEFDALRSQIATFSMANFENFKNTKPFIPSELNDRAADNWEPLFAIADIAGGNWPQIARDAAIALTIETPQDSIAIQLLQDIKDIFEARDLIKISTNELIDELCKDNEAPWVTYNRGNPISARQLATKLKSFSISSKDIRLSPIKNLKGYARADFEDAFNRYIPLNLT